MTLHEMWQVQNKHKKPGFILAISFDGCASSSRKEVQKYQKSLIYQTSLIEGSFAGRALMSPEKLFHSRKVLRATTKVKAQAKRRFLQTGTVSFRRRHVQLVFSDVFGMWLCSSNGSGRVRFSPTFWRLAEFFGPIKSEKNALPFRWKITQETRNSKFEGVKKLNLAVKIEYAFDQTVPCTLISFTVWIGGFGGKGRRKNERNDRIHIEDRGHRAPQASASWSNLDISQHATLQYIAAFVCLCGNVLSVNAGTYTSYIWSSCLLQYHAVPLFHYTCNINVEKPSA